VTMLRSLANTTACSTMTDSVGNETITPKKYWWFLSRTLATKKMEIDVHKNLFLYVF
jgi:hypothetical protein